VSACVDLAPKLLQGEAIFPHDYGLCYTHGPATVRIWEEHKRLLLHKIRAGTPLPQERRAGRRLTAAGQTQGPTWPPRCRWFQRTWGRVGYA
jgi:hypothetical protein